MMGEMEKGSCKSVGVYGWTADQIDAIVSERIAANSNGGVRAENRRGERFDNFISH